MPQRRHNNCSTMEKRTKALRGTCTVIDTHAHRGRCSCGWPTWPTWGVGQKYGFDCFEGLGVWVVVRVVFRKFCVNNSYLFQSRDVQDDAGWGTFKLWSEIFVLSTVTESNSASQNIRISNPETGATKDGIASCEKKKYILVGGAEWWWAFLLWSFLVQIHSNSSKGKSFAPTIVGGSGRAGVININAPVSFTSRMHDFSRACLMSCWKGTYCFGSF